MCRLSLRAVPPSPIACTADRCSYEALGYLKSLAQIMQDTSELVLIVFA